MQFQWLKSDYLRACANVARSNGNHKNRIKVEISVTLCRFVRSVYQRFFASSGQYYNIFFFSIIYYYRPTRVMIKVRVPFTSSPLIYNSKIDVHLVPASFFSFFIQFLNSFSSLTCCRHPSAKIERKLARNFSTIALSCFL